MPGFVQIPPGFLKDIARDSERIPTLYYHDNVVLRNFFWLRLRYLHSLIIKYSRTGGGTCLDFGGGGGVLLPSLSGIFARVTCIDLETEEAGKVLEKYGLGNVEIIQGDILSTSLEAAPFDTVVAADVLEHFRDLAGPVAAIAGWLKPDGILCTSLPTENLVYTTLRKVFGVVKPADHYHSARDVERFIENAGFVKVERRYMPLRLNILPLFSLTVWRKAGSPR